jgi:hypothetical protein
MKTKKQGKVLALKKKTIAHLNNDQMTEIVGGETWTINCTFDEYTCKCDSTNPVPSWDCNTLPLEFTCICEEFRTQCTKCDC